MSLALDPAPTDAEHGRATRAVWLGASAFASLGAGAIHAVAIGAHADHRPAAVAFTICAAVQLAWGVWALMKPSKLVAWAGLAVNGGALVGFVWAKASGIAFISGLDVKEPIGSGDGLAAGLALAAVLFAAVALAAHSTSRAQWVPAVMPIAAIGVVVLALVGMNAAGTHVHSASELATGGHDHGSTAASGGMDHSNGAMAGMDHSQPAVVPPHPYDPTKPIDLSGVDGVTPQQQAAAENLVSETIVRLPKWSDYHTAEAAGFYSIGDGLTGVEHYINDANLDDDTILDPDKPESLVYDTSKRGQKKLVAAMYMLKRGTPFSEVPDIGGKLMQWHIHNNLCFFPNGKLGGLTDGNGNCRAGLIKPVDTPMIHVWIEPHQCGPFAALEGIGGGQLAPGETKQCDHVHSS